MHVVSSWEGGWHCRSLPSNSIGNEGACALLAALPRWPRLTELKYVSPLTLLQDHIEEEIALVCVSGVRAMCVCMCVCECVSGARMHVPKNARRNRCQTDRQAVCQFMFKDNYTGLASSRSPC
jgi:hypothetical protein